jgi:large subunit ribosomal protein L24
MQKFKLKKNDLVIVKSGRRQDKKKTGKILRIVSEKNRVVVEKIHIIKEYVRPNPQKNIKGGIVEREGTIPIEKVMYYCKECEKGVRIGYKISDAGKQRVCKKCGVVLD